MKRTISIIGPIGSFSYKGKAIQGVQLVDVVAKVSEFPEDLKELVVEIGSPGGSVPVAKAIRGYLKSIQPRVQVTMKQVDDLASAGTILFGSGSKRFAAKGINPNTGEPFQFMVHNSWITNTEGNADQLEKEAQGLRVTDEEMISLYQEDIGISRETIMPLMKAESSFGFDQALSLKFATDTYEPQLVAAFNESNNPNKNTMDKTLKEKVLALLGITVATAPPAELMGKAVVIDGKPALDGVYTVVGGVITALGDSPAAAPAATPPAGQAAPAAAYAEVIALLKAQPKQDEAIAAAVLAATKQLQDEITAMKKGIVTPHTPVGFTPETKADDVKEWERSFKANEHAAMKKQDPEKYQRIFYAKYGKMPNM